MFNSPFESFLIKLPITLFQFGFEFRFFEFKKGNGEETKSVKKTNEQNIKKKIPNYMNAPPLFYASIF